MHSALASAIRFTGRSALDIAAEAPTTQTLNLTREDDQLILAIYVEASKLPGDPESVARAIIGENAAPLLMARMNELAAAAKCELEAELWGYALDALQCELDALAEQADTLDHNGLAAWHAARVA